MSPMMMRVLVWSGLLGIAAALVRYAGVSAEHRKVALWLVAAGAAAALAWMSMRHGRFVLALPPIHDISTDLDDPPAFVAVLPLRAAAPNPAAYSGASAAAAQRRAYPHLKPHRMELSPAEAFARAEAAVKGLGWEIVAQEPAEGRIEATVSSFLFGFKDDVVIRVRPDGIGTVVDVRSKSRLGRGDLGANAARIDRFLARLGR